MKFFGKQNNQDDNEDMNPEQNNSPQESVENSLNTFESSQPQRTGGIPNIAPAGFGKGVNNPSESNNENVNNDNFSISSQESLSQAAVEEPFEGDNEEPLADEEEILSNIETSALKQDKKPVLEILTPTLSGTDSELESLEREGVLKEDEVNGAVSPAESDKKKRSLFAKKEKAPKKTRKEKRAEDRLKTPRLDDGDETLDDEDENGENAKKKKSFSEMTVKDLLPSKKEKTEQKIPIGGNILIDLMPQSHKDVVATRDAKRRWTSIFAIVVAGCLMASGLSFAYNMQTQSQVSSEQSKQEALDLQIARHAEVNQALQSETTARGLLETSAGNEIDWNELISTIQTNLPQGTRITSLNVMTGGTPEDEISSAITMNLTSDSTLGYSDSLRAVENIDGVQQVEIGGLSVSGEGSYTYTMSFTFDTSILTERFATVEEPVNSGSSDDAPVAPEDNPLLDEDGNIDPNLLDTVDEAAQSEGDE